MIIKGLPGEVGIVGRSPRLSDRCAEGRGLASLSVFAGLQPGCLVTEAAWMSGEIMTEVSAIVPGERADDVPAAFAKLAQRPLPDGLLRTELLTGRDGEWKIQSLWRDQAALDAMRAGVELPAAPALFRRLGAEPVLRIYDLRARHTSLP